MAREPRSLRRRPWLWVVLGALGVLVGLEGNAVYYNQYRVVNPSPVRRIVETLMRPELGRIAAVQQRVVWTLVEGEQRVATGPWHRDWLLTLKGTRPSPWGGPLTYEVYVDGQNGGISAWYVVMPPRTRPQA